jgi:hypothetical protein
MKLISTVYTALGVAVCALTLAYAKPIFMTPGTSVIAPMGGSQLGGAPISIKLPDTLTKKQFELLSFAYSVAKADGHKYPQYLQGIIMQETRAGDMKDYRVAGLTNKVGDRYFGVTQIKLAAAKDVMKKYPELWDKFDTKTDEELEARLILDDHFNIRVASKYALMLGMNQDPTKAITAYNQGLGGAEKVEPSTFGYTVKVKQHAAKLS